MDINKGLSFLYDVAPTATAKVLDLGFNGDFDYKNHCWNNLFVSFSGVADNSNDLTIKMYAKQDGVPSTDGTTDLIATLTIPAAKVKVGGAFAFPMPKGLKRYVTVALSGVTFPDGAKAFCGITNDVDTDAIALGGGIDWKNYEAATLGTEVSPTPMKNVAALVGEGADGIAGALMAKHEAKSVGEVEGTAHVQSAG